MWIYKNGLQFIEVNKLNILLIPFRMILRNKTCQFTWTFRIRAVCKFQSRASEIIRVFICLVLIHNKINNSYLIFCLKNQNPYNKQQNTRIFIILSVCIYLNQMKLTPIYYLIINNNKKYERWSTFRKKER